MKTKPKAIIFLDIDGTLIDSYNGSNVIDAQKYFRNFQNDGLVFAINSNRSINDIIPIKKQFGLDAITICENGAFIYYNQKVKPKIFLSKSEQKKMKQVKRFLPQYVKKFFNSKPTKCTWITTDTVKYLKELNKHRFPNGQVIVLNNKFREYTVSAHIRLSENGSLVPAKKYIKPLAQCISKRLDKYNVEITGNEHYCNLLVNSKTVSKVVGVSKLKKLFPNIPLFGIGDELTDLNMIKDFGTFFTTNNATYSVKRKAKYVSKFSYTQGTIDIIQTQFNKTTI